MLRCFTDGAAKGNSKVSPAGWAFYLPKLNVRESGHMEGTNNQAELTAIKKLFEYLIGIIKVDIQVMVFTDSEYSIGVLTGNKAKVNKELIGEIIDLGVKIKNITGKQVKFTHVDAHTGGEDWVSKCNEVVDKLASDAAKKTDHKSSKPKS